MVGNVCLIYARTLKFGKSANLHIVNTAHYYPDCWPANNQWGDKLRVLQEHNKENVSVFIFIETKESGDKFQPECLVTQTRV
jgi:hypothetical protein